MKNLVAKILGCVLLFWALACLASEKPLVTLPTQTTTFDIDVKGSLCALTRNADGRSIVFVLKDGRAAAVTVTPGAALGDLVVIDAGLAGGERAILDPPAKLRDGSRVTVAEE